MAAMSTAASSSASTTATATTAAVDGMCGAIGNTPLIRLNRISAQLGPNIDIYGKAEFINPGRKEKEDGC